MSAKAAQKVSSAPPAGAQSIQRCFRVLRYVSEAGEGGCRLVEVASELGLHTATAHRMLRTLVAEGMLLYRAADRCYRMGPQLISLAAMAHKQFALRNLFQPALKEIAKKTQDTVFLQMYSGADDTICLAREEGEYPVRALTLDVGGIRPLGAGAAGFAILMYLPDDECDAILQRNSARLKKIGVTAALARETIDRSRELGFAVNEGLVTDVDIFGVGVLVTDASGIVAAISVTALRRRMAAARQLEIATIIRDAVSSLSHVRPYPELIPVRKSVSPRQKGKPRLLMKAVK